MTRYARHFVWLDPDDCDPPHGLDLSVGSRDSIKVEFLTEAFAREGGFDMKKPALLGYPLNGRIQLLSGTHRHEAAKRAGIRLPVMVRLRSLIEANWGKPEFMELIRDVPACSLECVEVPEGGPPPPGLDERIDFTRDLERDDDAQS